MSFIKLYIASSVDGFIAEKDGHVDWLNNFHSPDEDYGYNKFYSEIDALIMGRKTYDFCSSLNSWPYAGKQTFVFTSKKIQSEREEIEFINMNPSAEIYRIKTAGYKNIWLVGGGNLNAQFLNSNLIDEIILFVMPIVLGEGIPLFPESTQHLLDLQESETYPSGVIKLVYKPRRNN